MKLKLKLLPFLLALPFISACGPQLTKTAQVKETISVPNGANLKPVQLKKVIVKLPRGKKVGKMQMGLLCVDYSDLKWKSGRMNIASEDLTEVFYDEFKKAEYNIVGNPNNLFDNPNSYNAKYLIGGVVKDLEANVCYPMGGFGNIDKVKGGVFIDIEWQVYDTLNKKTVYSTTTKGSFQETEATESDLLYLFENAFGIATQNLLADKGFYDLVSKEKKNVRKSYSTLKIKAPKVSRKDIKDIMSDVRSSVVTVRAGVGHGSGYYISEDGYLLTNHHVAGEPNTEVKVTTVSGREILGHVVRSDAARDIALIKTESTAINALPITKKQPIEGSTVMAIGSPLDDEKYSTTVTKGIISAYRVQEGLPWIQADVSVLPGNSGGPLIDENGNVIGMTSWGRLHNNVSTSINMFVPIGDGLDSIGVQLEN
jgi:serine protease Do